VAALTVELFTVRALRGRLSALCVSHSKLIFYGVFVWAHRRLTAPFGVIRPGQGPTLPQKPGNFTWVPPT
jgi:hypothetical protein